MSVSGSVKSISSSGAAAAALEAKAAAAMAALKAQQASKAAAKEAEKAAKTAEREVAKAAAAAEREAEKAAKAAEREAAKAAKTTEVQPKRPVGRPKKITTEGPALMAVLPLPASPGGSVVGDAHEAEISALRTRLAAMEGAYASLQARFEAIRSLVNA
jgi:ATPase subunit of ABC transporter with duplicated ATPase domains